MARSYSFYPLPHYPLSSILHTLPTTLKTPVPHPLTTLPLFSSSSLSSFFSFFFPLFFPSLFLLSSPPSSYSFLSSSLPSAKSDLSHSREQNRPFRSSRLGFSLFRNKIVVFVPADRIVGSSGNKTGLFVPANKVFPISGNKIVVFVPAREDGGQWGLRSIFREAAATTRHHRRQSAKQLVPPDVSEARFCVQAVRRKGETGIVADSLYKRNAHSRYFMYKQFLQYRR